MDIHQRSREYCKTHLVILILIKINTHKIEALNRTSAHIIFAYNHNVDCFISDTPF